MSPAELQEWFAKNVVFEGKPYTLDVDQAKAVLDNHKNTLVTARAGSGKTRVIVAKVAYLVGTKQAKLSELAVFMFNRTAAAEVNQRVAAIEVFGEPLGENSVASTFHKFALDIVKGSGRRVEIISELEHSQLVRQALRRSLAENQQKVSPAEYADLLKLSGSFIARAGQKFCGAPGLTKLKEQIEFYLARHSDDPKYHKAIRIHRTLLNTYLQYLQLITPPKIDFNILMDEATRVLQEVSESPQSFPELYQNYAKLKYIMVDEYQDFSYLFFAIIQALRQVAPQAHLFAVGDDWQAINRFAGSDVDYFINFAQYFPEDVQNIPLLTNYRSDAKIVENANDYMLSHYDSTAKRAVAFNKDKGKITRTSLGKVRFDTQDILEDGLGDARFQKLLEKAIKKTNGQTAPEDSKSLLPAAKMLKACAKICRKNSHQSILLLHRHNFTSTPGVTLTVFVAALREYLATENIIAKEDFAHQIRAMTMHKSKGLEAEVVILLEMDQEQVLGTHPFASLFEIFGDNLESEKADQHRLIYVALTRAKKQLYLLTNDKKCIC